MGIKLEELSANDRAMYWSDSYVLSKETSELFHVVGYEDGCFIVRKFSMERTRSVRIRASTFEQRFVIHRFELGWRNVDSGCLFATHTPGRGNRKSYLRRDFLVRSPLWTILRNVNLNMRSRVEEDGNLYDQYTRYNEMLRMNHHLSGQQPEPYLQNYSAPMINKDEAVSSIISGARLGAAITPSWAVLLDAASPKKTAAVYFNTRPVGNVDKDGTPAGTWVDGMIEAWSRV